MKYYLLLLLSVCSSSALSLFSQTVSSQEREDIIPGRMIIKFREESALYQRWINKQRSSSFPEFATYIGVHSTEPLISNACLTALEKRLRETAALKITFSPVDNLRRLALMSFDASLQPQLLAQKISQLPDVEYAEPLPRRYVSSVPNDSLYTQQYYFSNIRASEAWDLIPANSPPILIAIVDTGIDFDHPDLHDNIFVNPGETGRDNQGRDKQTNNIDDDNNGFVDDWHGWDFAGFGSGEDPDNDPYPGNRHGTHVAGLAGAIVNNKIGVAGICNHVRLLPVKIGGDPSFSTSVVRSYEGVVYASAMGASIINCSWGGPTRSQAEQEIITTAIAGGAVVVAAAGNNAEEGAFYPAAYTGVVSVAAVGGDDRKSIFSNYHTGISLSAPGSFILSTFPENDYGTEDGTSMASPIVAGTAAMVRLMYPTLTPEQVAARVIATTDNIDAKNSSRPWSGKLGSGRVNTFRAVKDSNVHYITITKNNITDDDGDGIFEIGNTVRILPTFRNILAPVGNAKGVVSILTKDTQILLSDSVVNIGSLATNDIKQADKAFSFIVPPGTAQNTLIEFYVAVYENDVLIGKGLFSTLLRPTYRTLRGNNIHITVNSNGNYAYNDYPKNEQGEGLRYMGSPSIMFEGGLMIASSPNQLSNVVRGAEERKSDFSFSPLIPISVSVPGFLAETEASTSFGDNNLGGTAGVDVQQQLLQFTQPDLNNAVLVAYDIINRTPTRFDSLFCGVYADWDVGQSGAQNIARYDSRGFYYVHHATNKSLPYCGMKLLSNQPLNMYMIDNNGATPDNIGVYNGFTREEKWQTMSSGIGRNITNATDVSAVISAGPVQLNSGDTVRVVFSIFAAPTLAELSAASEKAEQKSKEVFGSSPAPLPVQKELSLIVSPNPLSTTPDASIIYTLPGETFVRCDITDVLGRTVAVLQPGTVQPLGKHTLRFSLNNLHLGGQTVSQTSYYVRLRTNYGTVVEPLIILR